MKHATKDHSYGKALLSGVSVIALGAALGAVTLPTGPAWAANFEIGTSGTIAADDTLINNVKDCTPDGCVDSETISTDAVTALDSFNIEKSAEISFSGGGTLTFAKDGIIQGGDDAATLTFIVGLGGAPTLVVKGGVNGGDDTTRGGNLVVTSGSFKNGSSSTGTFKLGIDGTTEVKEEVMLNTLTFKGGDAKQVVTASGGNKQSPGNHLDATIGHTTVSGTEDDTLDVTKLVVAGGAAKAEESVNQSVNQGGAGGNATVTINSLLTVGTGGIEVTGGAGAADAGKDAGDGDKQITSEGGTAALVVNSAITTATDLTITGGAAGSGASNAGAGGGAGFQSKEAAKLADVEVTGGAADGEVGGDAALDADDALTTTSLTLEGGAGSASAAKAGGAATATVDGAADLGAVTLTGGAAGDKGAGGDARLTVTAAAVKFSSLTMTDGADDGSVKGGAASLVISGTTAQTITGDIVKAEGEDDASGTISVENTAKDVTFKGTVAAGTIDVKTIATKSTTFEKAVEAGTINIGVTATETTATFKGDVKTTSTDGIDFAHDDSVLNISGTTDQTITGVITTANAGKGDINITNVKGEVYFTDKIGKANTAAASAPSNAERVGAITVTAGANVFFEDVVTATGLTAAAGTTAAEPVTSTLSFNAAGNSFTDLSLHDGTTISVGPNIAADDKVIAVTNAIGGTAKDTDKTLNVVINTKLEDEDEFVLIDGGASNGDLKDNIVFAENTRFTFAATEASNEITVTVSEKSAADAAKDLGLNADAAVGFLEAAKLVDAKSKAFTNPDLFDDIEGFGAANVIAEFAKAQSDKAVAKRLAEQVVVQADTLGAAVSVVNTPVVQSASIASSRLASLRTGTRYASNMQTGLAGSADMETGLSGAAMRRGNGAWVKPFGATDTQDSKGGVAGYDATTYGLAAGMDAGISDTTRVGAAISYSVSDAEGKAAGKSKVETSGFGLSLYGDYTTERFFLEGSIGYGQTSNDVTRTTTIGGTNLSTKGSYDATQYAVAMRAGMPLKMKGGVFVTPSLGLSWNSISPDKYTETGLGAQNVDVKSREVFTATLAGEISTRVKSGAGYLVPNAKLGVSYDVQNDGAKATANYVGNNNTFEVKGIKPSKTSGVIGLGVTYDTGLWSIGVGYDGSFRSGNTSHGGSIEARVKF